MGAMNRGSVDPRWQAHHRGVLAGFKNAIIQIIDPNTTLADVGYSAWTNTALNPNAPIVMWEGAAQLQVFRQTLNAEVPAGAITQVRSVRFTVPIDGPVEPVRKGLIVKVLSCSGDPDATRYQYTVTSGLGSGLGWDRTIEAESDMSVILPEPA